MPTVGMPTVVAHASEPLPADAIVPALTGTNVVQHDVVADALRRALDRAGLRSTRRAALVVPDGVARVSLLPFEQLPERASDLEQLVRLQLRKSMPFPLDEAVLTHFRAHTEGTAATLAVFQPPPIVRAKSTMEIRAARAEAMRSVSAASSVRCASSTSRNDVRPAS